MDTNTVSSLPIWRIDFCNSNTVRSIVFRSPSLEEAIAYIKIVFGERFFNYHFERITKL